MAASILKWVCSHHGHYAVMAALKKHFFFDMVSSKLETDVILGIHFHSESIRTFHHFHFCPAHIITNIRIIIIITILSDYHFSGLCHMMSESFCVATHRQLSISHPLFRLLAPHFLDVIAVNKYVIFSQLH